MTAIEYGVAYAIGSLFHVDGEGARYIRLNFAAHPPEVIAEGFRRLRAAWDAFCSDEVERQPIL
jgi:DNA-binding transcriptional MocR family regulator